MGTSDEQLRFAPAVALSRYLEHDGCINDDACGGVAGAYLAMLAEAGVCASEDDPIILAVIDDDEGPRASILDGNHRLLLALAEDPTAIVPYLIDREGDSSHPGFPYDGALD